VLQGLQFGIGALITLQVVACASPARLPVSAGTGPIPELPAPSTPLLPIATAGASVTLFASDLDYPL
jgi:hypothetical protein